MSLFAIISCEKQNYEQPESLPSGLAVSGENSKADSAATPANKHLDADDFRVRPIFDLDTTHAKIPFQETKIPEMAAKAAQDLHERYLVEKGDSAYFVTNSGLYEIKGWDPIFFGFDRTEKADELNGITKVYECMFETEDKTSMAFRRYSPTNGWSNWQTNPGIPVAFRYAVTEVNGKFTGQFNHPNVNITHLSEAHLNQIHAAEKRSGGNGE